MESDEDKKKLTDDVMVFMSKRSKTDALRYAVCLKAYVNLQKKRRRAAAARRHSDRNHEKRGSSNRKTDADQKEKAADNTDAQGQDEDRMSRKTCNPATWLFSIIKGTVTQFYYEILAAINGIFDRLTTIIHCQISCQRQDQVIKVGGRTRCDDPTENFTLDGGMAVTKEECANPVSSPGPSSTAATPKDNESKSKETDSDQKVTTSDKVNQSDTVFYFRA